MKGVFHIPDFYGNLDLNLALIDMINEHPERFYDGVGIASAYGSFPSAMWNGGRCMAGAVEDKNMKKILDEYNSRGIPCRFTFTNPWIDKEHLGDKYCNRILETAYNGINEVIVNSEVLEEYIRKKYPEFKFTSSTCKEIRDRDKLLEEIAKPYYLVVLDYNWNNKFDELDTLPDKHRLEILLNPYCYPRCPRRGDHYKHLGKSQIQNAMLVNMRGMMGSAGNMRAVKTEEFKCDAPKLNFYEIQKFSTFVTKETVWEWYATHGYEQFKIEGRTLHKLNVLESLVYYMARPEYKDIVRLELGLKMK